MGTDKTEFARASTRHPAMRSIFLLARCSCRYGAIICGETRVANPPVMNGRRVENESINDDNEWEAALSRI